MGVQASPRKTVAIRGLDVEIYHEIFSMAKKEGKRVADVVNLALESYLDVVNDGHDGVIRKKDSNNMYNGKFILRNDGEITLSKRDIMGLKKEVGPFRIENTGRIIFEKDIDKNTLKNIENIIIHSGTVEVPRTLYHELLIRSEIHGKLEKY